MKQKFSLIGIGLIVVFGGALVRVILQDAHASGALIDLARLTFFIGIAIVIIGLIRSRKKINSK